MIIIIITISLSSWYWFKNIMCFVSFSFIFAISNKASLFSTYNAYFYVYNKQKITLYSYLCLFWDKDTFNSGWYLPEDPPPPPPDPEPELPEELPPPEELDPPVPVPPPPPVPAEGGAALAADTSKYF